MRKDARVVRRDRRASVISSATQTLLAVLALPALALVGGCERCGLSPRSPVTPKCETSEFLREHRSDYRRSIEKARTWLDALHVDPVELRERGIKGKKKLTEQIDGYYRLWEIAAPDDRPALRRRIEDVVAVTYESRYHDMATINDREFKQDATSYLRTAVLMDRLGVDTTIYREEISKIHPRLNAHMTRRGPHQRAAFHWYYRHFGLEEPFPLEALDALTIAFHEPWNDALFPGCEPS